MKIVLDTVKCTGQGRCYSLAAELFEDDEFGFAVLKEHGELSPELHSAANQAVIGCPERAIVIHE